METRKAMEVGRVLHDRITEKHLGKDGEERSRRTSGGERLMIGDGNDVG